MTVNEQEIKNDLYEAVNGEWLKTAKIPDDKPATVGALMILLTRLISNLWMI